MPSASSRSCWICASSAGCSRRWAERAQTACRRRTAGRSGWDSSPIRAKTCGLTAHRYLQTDSASFRLRRCGPTAHHSVLWWPAPFLVTPPKSFHPFPKCRITSVGNRQRPPRGGSHERRTRGSSLSHSPVPRRPARSGHLRRCRPLRGLVPQVVASLPGGRTRGPLRPDAGQPLHRPAHSARTGADHSLDPSPAPGPRLAGHPLQPDRSLCHPRRAEEPRRPTTSLRTHHRARPGAQQLDRAPVPPGSAAATPGVPRPPQARAERVTC